MNISSIFLLVFESWNKQHHSQTIHPTEKMISMKLFKILCVGTWAWLFLTSMVMEAVSGQKRCSEHTLWHFNSTFGSSLSALQCQFFFNNFPASWTQSFLAIFLLTDARNRTVCFYFDIFYCVAIIWCDKWLL